MKHIYASCLVILASLFFGEGSERKCEAKTGRCFWLNTTGFTSFSEARAGCQSDGGDLAVVETEELWNFVANSFSLETCWIGLSDSAQESVFRWLNGAPLYYDKWRFNEPNGETTENCVLFWGAFELADLPCTLGGSHIAICSTAGPRCMEGKDGCLMFNEFPETRVIPELRGPASFAEAKETCENEGNRLLTVRSQAKGDTVPEIPSDKNIWLDLTDRVIESVFRWRDGGITTWVKWSPGQPNQHKTGNCVMRHPNGYWNDISCAALKSFMCEEETPDMIREKHFLNQKEGKLIVANKIVSKVVSGLSECVRLCVMQFMCQAFSLAENMACAVGSSQSEANMEDGAGVVYYNDI